MVWPASDFVFGVNLAWFEDQYGHDIGPDAKYPNHPVWYNPTLVSRYLHDIKEIGFQVVRFWIMERAENWCVDADGIVTGLRDTFLRNLDDLLQRADDAGLRLYLCFTETWNELAIPSPVRDARQQDAYLDRAVRPIVRRLRGSDVVWAFDVFNELESETRDDARHQVGVDQAQQFVRRNVEAIKAEDSGRLVSSGSGHFGFDAVRHGNYANLGLDFYDVHAYGDDGILPPAVELNTDRPVILGECGQGTRVDDDHLQRTSVMAFLVNAVRNGYAGCFVWRYGPNEEFFELMRQDGRSRPVVSDIREFLGGR